MKIVLVALLLVVVVSARDWKVGDNGLSRWDFGLLLSCKQQWSNRKPTRISRAVRRRLHCQSSLQSLFF